MTVITDRWWFNAKVNGRGAFLHDRTARTPFAENAAEREPRVVKELFEVGVAEAKGGFPAYLMDLAESAADAPGCSPFAPSL